MTFKVRGSACVASTSPIDLLATGIFVLSALLLVASLSQLASPSRPLTTASDDRLSSSGATSNVNVGAFASTDLHRPL